MNNYTHNLTKNVDLRKIQTKKYLTKKHGSMKKFDERLEQDFDQLYGSKKNSDKKTIKMSTKKVDQRKIRLKKLPEHYTSQHCRAIVVVQFGHPNK